MEHFFQSIPRPGEVRRVDATPWSALSSIARSHIGFEVLKAAFPGEDVWRVPAGRAGAAVLCSFAERGNEANLILIRRSLDLGRDPGLVAFPGGYIEPGEHPVDAALREAEEEIGLGTEHVELRAALGVYERPRTGIPVVGYLGLLAPGASFRPNPEEVHEIFEVPLAELLAEGAAWQEEWGPAGAHRVISFFSSSTVLGQNVVWGLTAAVVWGVLERVVRVLRER